MNISANLEQTNKISANNNLVAKWLFIVLFFVAAMVLIGGLTRLTGSGLSMTDWHPIHGVIPPIGEVEWLEEFDNYKQSPEYKKVNSGMELSEFKFIFMWEYVHRIAGRITGLVFLVPLIFFSLTRLITSKQSLQIIYGAFIAGLDGGLTYNTWPLMDGDFIPVGFATNGLVSLVQDIISVQFIHRWLAFLFLALTINYFVKIKSAIKLGEVTGLTALRLKKSVNMLLAVTILQVIIGIKTLIMVVPVPLASAHQMIALILLGNLVYIRRVIRG